MSRKNRIPLADRVARAADAALAAQHFVSAIDILVGIGWLDFGTVQRWRRGQIDCLEEVLQVNRLRISEAMRLFEAWSTARGLLPSPTAYVGGTPGRPTLRFSRDGNPEIESSYRTHWVSPELSEKKRERLAETASPHRAHEQVLADDCDDVVDFKVGSVAGGQHMVFKHPLEPIGPAVAHRPFDQPLKQMFASHVPARVIGLSAAASRRPATI